jgi:hypothetical protein
MIWKLSRDRCEDKNVSNFSIREIKSFGNTSQEFKELVGTCRGYNKHRSNSTRRDLLVFDS